MLDRAKKVASKTEEGGQAGLTKVQLYSYETMYDKLIELEKKFDTDHDNRHG